MNLCLPKTTTALEKGLQMPSWALAQWLILRATQETSKKGCFKSISNSKFKTCFPKQQTQNCHPGSIPVW